MQPTPHKATGRQAAPNLAADRAPRRIPASVNDFLVWLEDQTVVRQMEYCCIELDGPLDLARLRAAWRRTTHRVPVLRSELRLFDGEGYFEVLPEVDLPQILTVLDGADPGRAEAQERRFLREYIDPLTGPPARLLIRRLPEGDRLIFKVHHVAFDGGGMVAAAIHLAHCYRTEAGQRPEDEPLQPVRRDLHQIFGSVTARQALVLAAGALSALWNELVRQRDSSMWMDRSEPVDWIDAHDGRVRQVLVDAERLASLKAGFKSQGRSVNDGLLAVLGMAVARWNRRHGIVRDEYVVTCTTDLRHDARALGSPEVEGIYGNFASLLSVPIATRDLEDPGRALQVVGAGVRRCKQRHADAASVLAGCAVTLGLPLRLASRLLRPLARRYSRNAHRTSSVSNLGILPPASGDYGPQKARNVFGWASIHPPRSLVVTTATYGGRLNLAFCYDGAGLSEPKAEEFVALFMDLLDQAARL